jgi:hypothetical protein
MTHGLSTRQEPVSDKVKARYEQLKELVSRYISTVVNCADEDSWRLYLHDFNDALTYGGPLLSEEEEPPSAIAQIAQMASDTEFAAFVAQFEELIRIPQQVLALREQMDQGQNALVTATDFASKRWEAEHPPAGLYGRARGPEERGFGEAAP